MGRGALGRENQQSTFAHTDTNSSHSTTSPWSPIPYPHCVSTMEGILSNITPKAGCAVRGPTSEVAVIADKSFLTRLEIAEEALRLQCVHTSRLVNVIEHFLPHASAAGPVEDDGAHLSPLLPACQTIRARQRTVKRGRDAAAAGADCVPASVAWLPASPNPRVTVALAPTAPASRAVRHFNAEASSVQALPGSLGAVEKSEALSPPALLVGELMTPPPLEEPSARHSFIPDALLQFVGFLDSSTDASVDGDALYVSPAACGNAAASREPNSVPVGAQVEAVHGVPATYTLPHSGHMQVRRGRG